MPKQPPDENQEHEDGRAEREPRERESGGLSRHEITEADRRGGPGHTVLLAVALAIPAVKVAYTLGVTAHHSWQISTLVGKRRRRCSVVTLRSEQL